MSARPSKRALARQRQLNVLLRTGREAEAAALEASWASAPAPTFKPKVKEPAAYVERGAAGDVVRLTADGLAHVERLATTGTPQMKIASSLGITLKKLRQMMAAGQGENDVRLAFERGHGEYEARMLKLLMGHAKKSFVAAIYLTKSRLGWLDEGKQATAQIQNNVVLTLPKSRTRAEYFAMLGVPDPKTIAGSTELKTVEALPPSGLPAPDELRAETQPNADATAPTPAEE